MRKAAALGRKAARRRQQQQQQQPSKDDNPNGAGNEHSPNEKRKPTIEEALTAKNYRLAKELSDLRVRHREETKTVTRLTMENMNLASRCREAISHVAMLKKELAMHQRRAAEALAIQRQQAQRMASVGSEREIDLGPMDVAMEMERMDRIMASHAPPPPPPRSMPDPETAMKSPTNSLGLESSPTGEFFADFPADKYIKHSPSIGSNPSPNKRTAAMTPPMHDDDLSPDVTFSTKPIFPHSASPRINSKKRSDYNEGFPDELPARTAPSHSFRSSPGITEGESESSSAFHAPDGAIAGPRSSLDAFEASFDTAFPPSFASRDDEGGTGIYNPFFPSPSKTGSIPETSSTTPIEEEPSRSLRERLGLSRDSPVSMASEDSHSERRKSVHTEGSSGSKGSGSREGGRGRLDALLSVRSSSPSYSVRSSSPSYSVRSSSPVMTNVRSNSPLLVNVRSSSPSARIFPITSPRREMGTDMKSPERLSSSLPEPTHLRTPPHLTNRRDDDIEQPRRPEKAPSLSVRARYERALQPRSHTNRQADPSKSTIGDLSHDYSPPPASPRVDVAPEPPKEQETKDGKSTRNTPSLVLKRLQQRRVKERMAGETPPSPAPSMSPGKTSVSSFVNTFEAAAKRNEETTRLPRSDSRKRFSARIGRSSSSGGDSPPSDEENAPTRGQERAARELQSLARRVSGEGPSNKFDPQRDFSSRQPKALNLETISAEIRTLDAIANGYEASNSPNSPSPDASASRFSKLKRRVKQPVSYAEPSLHAKLRRGDVFFPRGSGDSGSVGSNSEDGSQSRNSRSRQDILHDLANPIQS